MFKFISQILQTPKENQNEFNSSKFKSRNKSNSSFEFIQLIENWEKIIGEQLGKHTTPLKIKGDCLYILTRHPIYSQELQFMSVEIKKKIFSIFPSLESKIHKLSFSADSSYFMQKNDESINLNTIKSNNNNKKFHEYSPLHQKLKQEGEMMFSSIDDNEMKDLLVSLYIQSANDN